MLEVQYQVQETPNPNAKKFIFDFAVKQQGRASYDEVEQCPHVPLACKLLEHVDICQVHFFENKLTITKKAQKEWQEVEGLLEPLLKELIPVHDPHFEEKSAIDKSHYNVEMHLIDGVLDREIRPFLQADGGDLQLITYTNHILTIKYQGACGGCPSAESGTLEAIVQILRRDFDDKIDVITIE